MSTNFQEILHFCRRHIGGNKIDPLGNTGIVLYLTCVLISQLWKLDISGISHFLYFEEWQSELISFKSYLILIIRLIILLSFQFFVVLHFFKSNIYNLVHIHCPFVQHFAYHGNFEMKNCSGKLASGSEIKRWKLVRKALFPHCNSFQSRRNYVPNTWHVNLVF